MMPWSAGKAPYKLSERDTEMGNTCCAGLAKSILKHRIKCEIINLLYKIFIVNGCSVDPRCCQEKNRLMFVKLLKH